VGKIVPGRAARNWQTTNRSNADPIEVATQPTKKFTGSLLTFPYIYPLKI
jgi:hypothetical protein